MRELEERVERLELAQKTDRLGVLELIEKVSKRLEWRERKREEARGNGQLEIEDDATALARARGLYGGR